MVSKQNYLQKEVFFVASKSTNVLFFFVFFLVYIIVFFFSLFLLSLFVSFIAQVRVLAIVIEFLSFGTPLYLVSLFSSLLAFWPCALISSRARTPAALCVFAFFILCLSVVMFILSFFFDSILPFYFGQILPGIYFGLSNKHIWAEQKRARPSPAPSQLWFTCPDCGQLVPVGQSCDCKNFESSLDWDPLNHG